MPNVMSVIYTTILLMVGVLIVGYVIQAADPVIAGLDNPQAATLWTNVQNFAFIALTLIAIGLIVMGAVGILGALGIFSGARRR